MSAPVSMIKPVDPISLELLAPAGNAEIGIAAINHGADAVYIGAPRFSARADAGVSFSEIAGLIQQAHFYYARVYVALNTILKNEELAEAVEIARKVYELGADGLIIQDPGLLELDLPPIPLIASTQMHNDTSEKIRFLEEVGFKRVILARELSLEDIRQIRRDTGVELEYFVHGALCVCYSGQCYMSQAVAGRSGNRGICGQPCRLRYTLEDGNGNAVLSNRFLLSLKDLNLLADIPQLVAAGITSFKIEGRYKEIDYVKNVTAAYRRALDSFLQENPSYVRSSSGISEPDFLPDPSKSFNRGFTRYFLSGRPERIGSTYTSKSMGQAIGTVISLGRGFFETDCRDLQNGDGLCFFTPEGELTGFRVERIENARVYPSSMKDLIKGAQLYRNYNIAFVRKLQKLPGRRRLRLEMDFGHSGNTICLAVRDEDGTHAEVRRILQYEKPKDPAAAEQRVTKQLSSTGNTPFKVERVRFSTRVGFYPISFINGLRRDALEGLAKSRMDSYPNANRALKPNRVPYPDPILDFRANVYNERAKDFYQRHGAEVIESAFETLADTYEKEVMKTRYCIRHELGACPKIAGSRRLKDPLYLSDERHRYLLKFDCQACRMSVIFLGRK